MGGRIVPPMDELFVPGGGGGGSMWRNFFENSTTVKFDHCVLAMSTYLATALLFALSRRAAMHAALLLAALHATTAAFTMMNMQVVLGISTLPYFVPVPLAAMHQAGSVLLLSVTLHVILVLHQLGAAARVW